MNSNRPPTLFQTANKYFRAGNYRAAYQIYSVLYANLPAFSPYERQLQLSYNHLTTAPQVLPPHHQTVGAGNDYSEIQNAARRLVALKNWEREGVSVIIPTYNRKEMLRKTLAALTHQTYPQHLLEIIIADDGSSDGVEEVIKKYTSQFNIRHVFQEDKGYRLAEIRNKAIKASRHDFVILLDCDLIVYPEFISAMMKYAHVSQDCVVMGHREFICADMISENEILEDIGHILSAPRIQTENVMFTQSVDGDGITYDWRTPIYEQTENLRKEPYPYNYFSGGHVLLPKSIFDKIGFFDEEFQTWGYEDNEFGFRAYNAGYYFIPDSDCVDLHMEPPGGQNETDRLGGQKVSKSVIERKCPSPLYRNTDSVPPGATPKISVCIVVNNVESYIENALQSLAAQKFLDFEVIIVDDGSSDSTLKEISRLSKIFHCDVKLLKEKKIGFAEALNMALKQVRGMYVVLLHGDDEFLPGTLQKISDVFDNSDHSCICGNVEFMNANGEKIDHSALNLYDHFTPTSLAQDFPKLLAFRMRDWSRTQGLNLSLCSGVTYDLLLKLGQAGRIFYLNEKFYKTRLRVENTSAKSAEVFTANCDLALQTLEI